MTSIAAERSKLAVVGLVLRSREQWGARFDYTTARTVTEPASHQFVHISVTNPSAYPSNDAHARAIEDIGIDRFPSTGISYNRLILPGGQPYEGQPIGRRGAHTINDDQRSTCNTSGCPSNGRPLIPGGDDGWNLNYTARGYVFARNCGDAITEEDRDAMARCLAADRLAGFVKRDATLHGHRCCSDKSCPCDPAWGLMGDIENRMNAYLTKGNVEPEEPMPTADEIAQKVWTYILDDDGAASASPSWGTPTGADRHAGTILRGTRGDVSQIKEAPSAPGGGATVDEVRKIVREEIANALENLIVGTTSP